MDRSTILKRLRCLLDKVDDERFREQIKQLVDAEEAGKSRAPPLLPPSEEP
jgi:hypothetical protein